MTLWNRCQRTASRLDKVIPNWYNLVNLDKLDMGTGSKCIVGQASNIHTFSAATAYCLNNDLDIKALGYSFEMFGMSYYNQLTKYWRTLIKQRRSDIR